MRKVKMNKEALERQYSRIINRAREGRLPSEEAEKRLNRIEKRLGYTPEVNLRLQKVNYWEK